MPHDDFPDTPDGSVDGARADRAPIVKLPPKPRKPRKPAVTAAQAAKDAETAAAKPPRRAPRTSAARRAPVHPGPPPPLPPDLAAEGLVIPPKPPLPDTEREPSKADEANAAPAQDETRDAVQPTAQEITDSPAAEPAGELADDLDGVAPAERSDEEAPEAAEPSDDEETPASAEPLDDVAPTATETPAVGEPAPDESAVSDDDAASGEPALAAEDAEPVEAAAEDAEPVEAAAEDAEPVEAAAEDAEPVEAAVDAGSDLAGAAGIPDNDPTADAVDTAPELGPVADDAAVAASVAVAGAVDAPAVVPAEVQEQAAAIDAVFATEDSAAASATVAGTAALSLRGVQKSFGDTRAVDGIDLTVPAGTFYGLVGPNGAGKTTTLSMIAGLLRPDRGSIVVGGVDAAAHPLKAKRLMGVLPDRLRTFDRLTGRQLLYYFGVLRGLKPAVVESRTADLARAFDLTDALGRVVSDYSAGMTKKVMLAGAMIHSPRLLVLDEPFEAVDPVSSAVILDILSAYVAHGGTVILSSHGMDLVERVCSRVAVLVAGQVLAEGTIDDVRGELTLEQRFIELAGGLSDVEGLEWLHTFSD
ncbi:ABC transporter ATP-binding protein [Microbacterium ulmi]|uniref:ABC transporter ATP-binding protein n=1 Tax=Microbacterium ulmi TaxID=179095 RepID=UPI0031332FC3|nr:ABC-2 type transport system ATP-binding protein [Microbacterium ulmi]